MNTYTQDPSSVFGYDVVTSGGDSIGSVDGVWVDDATNQLEFIGVKTGWLFGQTHVVPVADAQITDGTVQVPYSSDQVKDAPSFGTDDELSPEAEQQIYDYYGLGRTTSNSQTGLASGDVTTTSYDTGDVATTGYDTTAGTTAYDNTGLTTDAIDTTGTTGTYADSTLTTDTGDLTDDQRLRLHEEQLQVGKREVSAGEVRLRKIVRTQRQEVPVELRTEDVQIERVPVSDVTAGIDDATAFQEQEIDVPLTREEAVVGKTVQTTGEVQVNKNVQTRTETVGADVRSEDVEVDDASGLDTTTTGYTDTTRTNTTDFDR